jgi:hypothetical protein
VLVVVVVVVVAAVVVAVAVAVAEVVGMGVVAMGVRVIKNPVVIPLMNQSSDVPCEILIGQLVEQMLGTRSRAVLRSVMGS